MKKKIFTIALIMACLSIMAFGTTAYFTYEDTATNTITTGNIKIDLEEFTLTDTGEMKPFEDVIDVLPGTEVPKIVQVKNTGSDDAFIRISVQKAINLAEGVEGDVDTSLILPDYDAEAWTEKDGFYYYNEILSPGETTQPLFTKVTFSTDMGNIYQGSQAVITVTAHATQVVHNGNTALEAAGWPEIN